MSNTTLPPVGSIIPHMMKRGPNLYYEVMRLYGNFTRAEGRVLESLLQEATGRPPRVVRTGGRLHVYTKPPDSVNDSSHATLVHLQAILKPRIGVCALGVITEKDEEGLLLVAVHIMGPHEPLVLRRLRKRIENASVAQQKVALSPSSQFVIVITPSENDLKEQLRKEGIALGIHRRK